MKMAKFFVGNVYRDNVLKAIWIELGVPLSHLSPDILALMDKINGLRRLVEELKAVMLEALNAEEIVDIDFTEKCVTVTKKFWFIKYVTQVCREPYSVVIATIKELLKEEEKARKELAEKILEAIGVEKPETITIRVTE